MTIELKDEIKDLLKNETLTISNKDRDNIITLLENPPEPNENLKGLFE